MFGLPLMFREPAIVILNGMQHIFFLYSFGNAEMVQSGDELIYFSRQSHQKMFSSKKTITLFIYKNIPPGRSTDHSLRMNMIVFFSFSLMQNPFKSCNENDTISVVAYVTHNHAIISRLGCQLWTTTILPLLHLEISQKVMNRFM